MYNTIILEGDIKRDHQKSWFAFLNLQKNLVEKHFEWLNLKIDLKERILVGHGTLNIEDKPYKIKVFYSPYYKYRYERIYIENQSIKYNDAIHLYKDLSLCLYHPTVDQAIFNKIPLFKIIPRIGEWIVFYEQWKKYGVWMGKEIKHIQNK